MLEFLDWSALIVNVLYTIFLARLKVWSWGLGILGALLTVGLYIHDGDASLVLLQVVYVIFFSYGLYSWAKYGVSSDKNQVCWMNAKNYILYTIYTVLACVLCILFNMWMNVGDIYTTGILTGITLVAIVMTIQEFLENWIVWIISDLYFVAVMFSKGWYGQTIQNFIFFLTAVYGFYYWYTHSKKTQKSK